MDVFCRNFGNLWDSHFLVEVSESKVSKSKLFIFLYVEDHATIFFLTVDCAALFFSKKTLSLKEYPLRICKTVRYEEATETMRKAVKLCDTQ